MRNLLWRKEKAFEGFVCSDCGWLSPNPKLSSAPDVEALKLEIQAEFDQHDCAKHPRKPKRSPRR
jgi:hypothetical protein